MDKKNKERTTPPPASQERGGLRWPSSLGIAAIAREIWGNPIPPEAYAFAKRLHSAASPPSSAAEVSINSPEIYSKLIPGAAEQAKPVAYTECTRDCDCVGECKAGLEKTVAEQAQAGELPPLPEPSLRFCSARQEYVPDHYTADQMREYANACRLAGGVTDEMVERAAFTWRYYTGSTENNARMRAAMVAALGAK